MCCLTVHITAAFVLFSAEACAQSAPAPKPPEFDVASIRPGRPTAGDAIICEGGRLTVYIYDYTLRTLNQMAWRVRDVQVIGGPSWMDSDSFYIAAKGDPSATDDQCRAMLQTLLKDRFRLALHNDQKELPVYALVVSAGGPKFHESDAGVAPNIVTGKGRLSVQKVSMANVARVLPSSLDHPVLDKTGLTGRYTFTLEWDSDEEPPAGVADAGALAIPGLPRKCSPFQSDRNEAWAEAGDSEGCAERYRDRSCGAGLRRINC